MLFGVAANVAGRDFHGLPEIAFYAFERGSKFLSGHSHRLTFEVIELTREFEQPFVAACAHGFEDRAHHFLSCGEPGFPPGQNAAHVFRFENSDHFVLVKSPVARPPALHDYLVQRVFDDTLAARLLEARNDRAHRRFVQDGIDGQPLSITQMRDGGALQRG